MAKTYDCPNRLEEKGCMCYGSCRHPSSGKSMLDCEDRTLTLAREVQGPMPRIFKKSFSAEENLGMTSYGQIIRKIVEAGRRKGL
jgi:hypothetical protein